MEKAKVWSVRTRWKAGLAIKMFDCSFMMQASYMRTHNTMYCSMLLHQYIHDKSGHKKLDLMRVSCEINTYLLPGKLRL